MWPFYEIAGAIEYTRAMDRETELRQQVINRLSSHDITPTRQRVEIGMCLFDRDQHITADQLLEDVNSRKTREVSKATIYNTLGLFAEKGLLREVVVDPNKLVYDTNTSNHYHIYNLDSGKLKDIQADKVNLDVLTEVEAGLEIEDVDIIIRVREKKTAPVL